MTWYDWFLPTSMIGGIVFGTLISIIYAYLTMRETNSRIRASVTLLIGVLMTVLLVWMLRSTGMMA